MFRFLVSIAVAGVVVSLIAPKSGKTRIILLLSTFGIIVGLVAFFALGFRNSGIAQEKITLQSSSPDGSHRVTLRELPVFLDRNFVLELLDSHTGQSKEVFRSPDEGLPGSERIIWSEDGTRFLLLGTNFVTVPAAALSDGEQLYLMYDLVSGTLRCNASQQDKYLPFTTNHLISGKWLGFHP